MNRTGLEKPMAEAPGVLHVADATGEGCRYCDYLWFSRKTDKGLRVDPGTRVEVYAIGSVVAGYKTTRPLDVRVGSECEPCWEVMADD